jgi:hypothetical protein
MAGFRYASGTLSGRSDKKAKQICDRCGFMVRIDELKWESTGAKGSPQDRRSGLRVCPECFDPIHPLSKLPDAIRMKLPDAEALYQPRVDIFPRAYPVAFTIPGAIFKPVPLTVHQGTTINLLANGTYNVYPTHNVSAIGDSDIAFSNVIFNTTEIVNITATISPTAVLGHHDNLFIVDGAGRQLRGHLNVAV